MKKITVQVEVREEVDVDVSLDHIIAGIYECGMAEKWGYFSAILNNIQLDIDKLTTTQKMLIYKDLQEKIKAFKFDEQ